MQPNRTDLSTAYEIAGRRHWRHVVNVYTTVFGRVLGKFILAFVFLATAYGLARVLFDVF